MENRSIILQGITLQEFRQIIREEAQILKQKPIQEEPDQLLNLEKLLDFLEEKTSKRPARQTIYDWVNKRQIPFEKHGKYLFFRTSIILAWLNNGRAL